MNTVAFILFSSLILSQFALAELLKRRLTFAPELSRKITHITSSLTVCAMPFYLSKWEIAIMSVMFLVVLLLTKRFNILTGIHGVRRKTIGEFTFPIGVLLAAVALLPTDPQAFQFAFILFGLADPAAELGGGIAPIRSFDIFGQTKSLGGWLAFVVVGFLCGVSYMYYQGSPIPYQLLFVMAAILATVELLQVYGLDNLSLPVVTGVIWLYFFP